MNKIIEIIKNNLTVDLLTRKWKEKNIGNPTAGYCYYASAVLKRFYPKEVMLYRGVDHEGEYHWWCQTKSGDIIDITAEQYTSKGFTPPYEKGEKKGPLGFSYRDKARLLEQRVLNELGLESLEDFTK